MKTPYDFGAAGDGVTDDTVALQTWLDTIANVRWEAGVWLSDGGCGYLAPGRYLVNQTLLAGSGTKIIGGGKGSSVLMTRGPENFGLLQHRNLGSGVITRDLHIEGVCFEGDANATEASPNFVDFVDCAGVTFRDCRFADRAGNCLTFARCSDIVVDACEFSRWGRRAPFEGPPGTWVGGAAIFCYQPCQGGRISNCYLHDSTGGMGIWLPVSNTAANDPGGQFWTVTGNIIRDVDEAGIVGYPDMTTDLGNVVANIRRKDVSGHGREIHGRLWTCIGNVTANADGAGMYVSNSSLGLISSNVMHAASQQPGASPLIVAAFGPEAGQGSDAPHNLTVGGNVFGPGGEQAIEFVNLSGDPDNTMTHVETVDCNCGPPEQWEDEPIKVGDDVAGKGFVIDEDGSILLKTGIV